VFVCGVARNQDELLDLALPHDLTTDRRLGCDLPGGACHPALCLTR